MTIIVSWINKEDIDHPSLWTVADGRLSKKSSNGYLPLLNCGAKLFSIRVLCFKPSKNGFFNDIYFTKTIGMAFAGASLIALNLYAFLSYTLGALASASNAIPSMEELARHAYAAFKSLLNDYIETNTDSMPCEISIFGSCSKTNEYELFHMIHDGRSTETIFNKIDLSGDDAIHFMGDHVQDIERSIKEYRALLKIKEGAGWLRYPKTVIENVIRRGDYDPIGGGVQLGIADIMGFKIFSLCSPIVFGQSRATFIHQGIDLYSSQSLMHIGDCFVKVNAIS